MSASSLLRRVIAVGGLLLVVPIGMLLVTSQITLADAGMRAAILFGAVMVLRSIAGMFPGGTVVVRANED